VNLRLDRSLEGSLEARAAGRAIVIDAYRSWSCGTWVGDLTARLGVVPDPGVFVEAEPVDGVRVFLRPNLARLLVEAGASLHGGGLFRRSGLRIELDRPELWIDWLEHPGANDASDLPPSSTAIGRRV
jgi:hypothetical protein